LPTTRRPAGGPAETRPAVRPAQTPSPTIRGSKRTWLYLDEVTVLSNILLAGVDTLAVGFSVREFRLTPEEWVMLDDAKFDAQGTMFDSGGTPVKLRGKDFSVNPKGGRGYEYVLVNDDVTIQLAERAESGNVYPEIHITWRSAYLWRYGWRATYSHVRNWVSDWADISGEKVSRADLCVDLNRSLPEIDLKGNEVVSRAQSKTEFYIQHHLKGLDETGYSFGQGNLKCRIYDKIAEVKHSNKIWFQDMWKKRGWDGRSAVTRVEFQARRDFLRSMQIETVEDLDNQLADLWRYYIAWVSLRNKGGDSNRRRWPLKPFWEVVCNAVPAFGVVTGVVRIVQRRPRMESLAQMGRGCLITLAALVKTNTGGSSQAAIGFLEDQTKEWLANSDFQQEVTRRAGRLAFMH